MTNRAKKVAKRNKKLRKRRSVKGRMAIQNDGNSTTVFESKDEGYDVQMVRDFLEHLLLEVRVRQYEDVKALRTLKSTNDIEAAFRAAAEPSDTLIEQFAKYQAKYSATLLPATQIDGDDATDEEIRDFISAFLRNNIDTLDAEIGHLEALQDLFDEALLTAKLPFGMTESRQLVLPQRVHVVRKIIDENIARNIPNYDDLLCSFEGHALATEAGMKPLRTASIIVAQSDAIDERLALYGRRELQRLAANGERNVTVLCVTVRSFPELQFVLSAIQKFLGPPDTDGMCWQGIW